jgi:hypothetical protein
MSDSIKFKAKLWVYSGKAAWYFVDLPQEESMQIKFNNIFRLRGFGSLPVIVRIGKTEWKTSIFPNSKTSSYLLPIKAIVRKSENLKEGDMVSLELRVS